MTNTFKFDELKEAANRLGEGLDTAKSQLEIDGVLQRFEFTFELSWKTIQEYAKYQGILVASPRESVRIAGDLALIDNVELWLEYLEERNKTTHIYDAKMAKSIFDKLPTFAKLVSSLITNLTSKTNSSKSKTPNQ